ncbi:DUF192 domain-containing protein [Patescibacteria group bacterium]|nr:DUF192 domain-containing protein [Patescibacteria group bacterium]
MHRRAMTATILTIVILLILGGAAYYLWTIGHAGHAGAQPSLPTVSAVIGGQQFELEVASTTAEQNWGLSGRISLGGNDGMLFLFSVPGPRFFWMKDMNFDIDLIWIRGDKVIGFLQGLPTPAALHATSTINLPIYVSPGLVDKVIEINSGEIAKLGLKVGDTIRINI